MSFNIAVVQELAVGVGICFERADGEGDEGFGPAKHFGVTEAMRVQGRFGSALCVRGVVECGVVERFGAVREVGAEKNTVGGGEECMGCCAASRFHLGDEGKMGGERVSRR